MATADRLALLPPCGGTAALPGPGAAGEGEAEGVGPGLLWVAGDWADAGLVKSVTAEWTEPREERKAVPFKLVQDRRAVHRVFPRNMI